MIPLQWASAATEGFSRRRVHDLGAHPALLLAPSTDCALGQDLSSQHRRLLKHAICAVRRGFTKSRSSRLQTMQFIRRECQSTARSHPHPRTECNHWAEKYRQHFRRKG